jgi:hypothetical protein
MGAHAAADSGALSGNALLSAMEFEVVVVGSTFELSLQIAIKRLGPSQMVLRARGILQQITFGSASLHCFELALPMTSGHECYPNTSR